MSKSAICTMQGENPRMHAAGLHSVGSPYLLQNVNVAPFYTTVLQLAPVACSDQVTSCTKSVDTSPTLVSDARDYSCTLAKCSTSCHDFNLCPNAALAALGAKLGANPQAGRKGGSAAGKDEPGALTGLPVGRTALLAHAGMRKPGFILHRGTLLPRMLPRTS